MRCRYYIFWIRRLIWKTETGKYTVRQKSRPTLESEVIKQKHLSSRSTKSWWFVNEYPEQWFPTFFNQRTPFTLPFSDPTSTSAPPWLGLRCDFFLAYANPKRPEMAFWDMEIELNLKYNCRGFWELLLRIYATTRKEGSLDSESLPAMYRISGGLEYYSHGRRSVLKCGGDSGESTLIQGRIQRKIKGGTKADLSA